MLLDILYIVIVGVFFIATAGLIAGLQNLIGG
jgi:hypothetical protein